MRSNSKNLRELLWRSFTFFMFIAVFISSTNGSMFEGDQCTMKAMPGICRLASECPALRTAVESGQFSSRDIINCGFAAREEIICCPSNEPTVEVTSTEFQHIFEEPLTSTSTSTSTTETAMTDFWAHLLTTPQPNIITTTTAKPDFWLHLLNKTTTTTAAPDFWLHLLQSTTTTTTTPQPLVIGGKKLDPDSEFFDLSQMLSKNNKDKNKNTQTSDKSKNNPPRVLPEAIVDRSMGWQNRPRGIPTTNWNTPNPGRFNTGVSFPNNRRNNPQGRLNFPPIQQTNFEHMPISRPSQPPLRFPFEQQPISNTWNNMPVSENIWNNGNFVQRPSNQWSNAPVLPMNSLPNRPIWPVKSSESFDPVAVVNQNLINSGLDIIKANEEIRIPARAKTTTTTQASIIQDPFAPFQFRPRPDQHNENYIENNNFPSSNKKNNNDDKTTKRPSVTSTTVSTRINERPAVKACREIDDGLSKDLTPHILGGTPAELGEFPHMAAIGFGTIGNDQGPYDYRCGGTLIASKFVLTAAHCVNSRESQPLVVLLGLVNITNANERSIAQEVPIEVVHIHPEYFGGKVYHDIAILELAREVQYSEFIYPTCLYSEPSDPPSNMPLYATGWGKIRVGSKETSNLLLKAKLEVVPVSQCNESYVATGLNRRIDVGITNSQLCAHDPGFTRDACQGDSGGPLNMVVDETLKKYRVVGVISAGFSCGSETPGLYARVSAYLDYIESVVWHE